MPGIFQRRFYATLRAPSADALEILAPHASRILSQWRREARALAVEPDRLLAGTTFNFVQLANELRKSQYPDFKRRLQQFGENLAKQGVKLQNAIAAYNRLFEMSVANLIRSVPQRAALITGLVGLHDLVTLLILTGYTDMWAAGNKTLRERCRAKGETRRYKTSEVTRIYEQERRRLSQDLHDQIGHDLVLIKLHLEMIAMEHDQNQPPNQPRIAEAIALVSQAIDALRRLVFDLGPAVFDELGFLPAVRSYASQFSERSKIQVKVRAGHLPKEIPMSHQVALYRLLQGALSNVLKHASARNVRVSLRSGNRSMIIMVVEDDGVGFDPSARANSFGLTAMRERIEALGGKIEVKSKPAKPMARRHGTTIRVGLPLP